jgi:hypothetical protein
MVVVAAKDCKLLTFGSLKGGVGKTTLSLLAVEALLQRRDKLIESKQPAPVGVILIDADIVGTEASDVAGNEYVSLASPLPSLIDIIGRVPDSASVYAWLEAEIAQVVVQLNASDKPRALISSFARGEVESKRRVWREILEHSGLYIQRRMRDLVSVCRHAGLDVVVDLPAFDVGFAHQVRTGLAPEKPAVFFVTDCDVRSIRATLTHQKLTYHGGAELSSGIVVNRIPDDVSLDVLRSFFDDQSARDCVFVRNDPTVLKATRANEIDGEAGSGKIQEPPVPPTQPAPLHARLVALLATLADKDRERLLGAVDVSSKLAQGRTGGR